MLLANSVNLDTALKLPAPDIEALIQGRAIAAMPRTFIDPGRKFALYPTDASINLLPTEQYYRSNFLSIAQTAFAQLNSETVTIKAWAKCELCQIIDNSEALGALSQLTIWTTEALQQILSKRPYIFLTYLRVYPLTQPIEAPVDSKGQFVHFSPLQAVFEDKPVLSDRVFTQQRHQLEHRLPPPHPELEELQNAIAQLSINNLTGKELDRDIKIFLGWTESLHLRQSDPDLDWINTIADLGNRSKENEGTSNYQAGTDFEIVVRNSLEFLGFTVDYFHKGGAGGVDVFCSQPYPLVGECKAGRKIPNPTAVQLLNLGMLRLQSKELFQQAAKLIIGPGEPTTQLNDAAIIQGMAIINPETLEKLVKLQSKHRNSVDLFKLKDYLKPGQSDDEVEKYIAQVEKEIRLRSHLVQLVKNYLQNTGLDNAGVEALHGAYFSSNPPQPLKTEEMHDILIELSSPLTGYLGRIKGKDWGSDRFYFLRDLPAA
ncbi:DUF1802 family protein [Coleofasciculus sp. H7-2]|uniref:DUF1802 family protein n=1 Tax=Coleofasciculus sp. H7-2 TaxID=3351545 RepID=UPI00366E98EB